VQGEARRGEGCGGAEHSFAPTPSYLATQHDFSVAAPNASPRTALSAPSVSKQLHIDQVNRRTRHEEGGSQGGGRSRPSEGYDVEGGSKQEEEGGEEEEHHG